MKTIKTCLLNYMLNGLYLCLYALILPAILYRRVFKGRSLGSFTERFLGLAPVSDRSPATTVGRCVWLHAVSVGEVNLLDTLLDHLRSQYADARFVISTTTATGMRLAKKKYPDHPVFYFPIDFSWAIKNVLKRVQPDLVVLTELEVWPNLVSIASRRQTPVVVVNGRLSEKSFRGYQKWRRLVQPTFERLDQVVAQTQEYADRFVALGCPVGRVHVAGSIKFDGATRSPDPELINELRIAINLKDDEMLWVAGSTQDPEEKMVARIWKSLNPKYPQMYPHMRLVIVPRHPDRGRKIQQQLLALGVESSLRSQCLDNPSLPQAEARSQSNVLIADTIGELTAWWSLASIAFVGGSFGDRGGQNMLEPAAMGAAVCFGPNTWNFKEIVATMRTAGIGTELKSEAGLQQFIETCLNDPEETKNQGRLARQFVIESQGAILRTCRHLTRYFESQSDLANNEASNSEASNSTLDQEYRAA